MTEPALAHTSGSDFQAECYSAERKAATAHAFHFEDSGFFRETDFGPEKTASHALPNGGPAT